MKSIQLLKPVVVTGWPDAEVGQIAAVDDYVAHELVGQGAAAYVNPPKEIAQIETRDPIPENRDPSGPGELPVEQPREATPPGKPRGKSSRRNLAS